MNISIVNNFIIYYPNFNFLIAIYDFITIFFSDFLSKYLYNTLYIYTNNIIKYI